MEKNDLWYAFVAGDGWVYNWINAEIAPDGIQPATHPTEARGHGGR